MLRMKEVVNEWNVDPDLGAGAWQPIHGERNEEPRTRNG